MAHTADGQVYWDDMSSEPTLPQDDHQRQRARQKSLQQPQPPTEVPGYDMERLLGVGAYGEVWVAVQRNTGRRVAIKFYAHRGGLDWSLLSREVEKLAFLFADRYVVQLIGVGWDADPPYYIMEYLPYGSLADRLEQGPLPAAEAVALLRDIATGLLHAHNKGVLHCDLKPANILLDQDEKPRLADFGQSRLSHEQTPALGTLFYMAPEQADLNAVPDARWDVYALGALLYCMLTGQPPYRTEELAHRLEEATSLQERLHVYRTAIRNAPPPSAHRRVRGVDKALATIVDRCLAANPRDRFANVQAVLSALDARAAARSRRPTLILGAVGPALMLIVVALFAWSGFVRSLQQSNTALVSAALRSNGFAAEFVARAAANQLERRFEAVEQVAYSPQLRRMIEQLLQQPGMSELLDRLSDPAPLRDPSQEAEVLEPLREQFRKLPARVAFQAEFEKLIPARLRPGKHGGNREEVASWFFCDSRGISVARAPLSNTIGKNYAWRSFFHGGLEDLPHEWDRPGPGKQLRQPHLSAVFRSQAHNQWIVAVACPVYETPPNEGRFLGVVALTVRVGRFMELESGDEKFPHYQVAVLVDERPGAHSGMILQHPLLEQLAALPESELTRYRLPLEKLPDTPEKGINFVDPLAPLAVSNGLGPPNTRWLAQAAPVLVRGQPTGWWVIAQEPYDGYPGTIGWTLAGLRRELLLYGLVALAVVVLITGALWGTTIGLFYRQVSQASTPRNGNSQQEPFGRLTPGMPTETHRQNAQ